MRFEILPGQGAVDSELAIRVLDAPPRSRVDVEVETEDSSGIRWRSHAQFLAGESGNLDLTKEPPIQGSYTNLDPMGLVTSMVPADKSPASIFTTSDAAPMELTFRATESHSETAVDKVMRYFQEPGVLAEHVDSGGIRGVFYRPDVAEQRPAMLVVPGFIDWQVAALPLAAMLASRGYPALVLDHREESGIPGNIAIVPLEYFVSAANWLRQQPGVDPSRIGGYGIEKGAEGLLAAASYLPELDLQALIAVSPSCVIWQASGLERTADVSSWTLGGQPLPFLPVRIGRGQKLVRTLRKREGGATSQLIPYTEAFKDAAAFKKATLPVEKIAAPILLLAGFDDQVWPSGQMAELIYRARRMSNCNEGDQKLTFEKAGRVIRFPYLPAAVNRWVDPSGAGGLMLGGTPEANLHANTASWSKLVEFVTTHLGFVDQGFSP